MCESGNKEHCIYETPLDELRLNAEYTVFNMYFYWRVIWHEIIKSLLASKTLSFPSHNVSEFWSNLNHLWCCIWYHSNHWPSKHWVDITFSVLSCLLQEIQCKIHHPVMAESKMTAVATSISENVQGPTLYKCITFHYTQLQVNILHLIPGIKVAQCKCQGNM